MDSFWGLLLNGIFGLIFSIIGYKAVIKGAQIQADAERQKNQRAEKPNIQAPPSPATLQKNDSYLEEIHWSWWAIYLALGFGIWICATIWESEVGFIVMILFFLLVVPASTIWVALHHPIRWNYSIMFISITYLIILIFALMSDLYVDLYEDVPLWAWTYANIGAVVVISIQRQQSKKRK